MNENNEKDVRPDLETDRDLSRAQSSLLWNLSRQDDERILASAEDLGIDIEDEILAAYRDGSLPERQAQSVERALASSTQARRTLANIVGLDHTELPEGTRDRVLSAIETGTQAAMTEEAAKVIPFSTRVRQFAVPLAIAAALLLAVVLVPRGNTGMPQGVHYDVRATGLAQVRGEEVVATTSLEAEPETLLRLEALPEGMVTRDLDFGLYTLEGNSLVRSSARAAVDRGAARFEVIAADLIGSEPGTRRLWVAVAREGKLPQALDAEGAEAAELLADNGQRLVYPVDVTIVGPASEMVDAR